MVWILCGLRDFSWLLFLFFFFKPPVMMSNHSNERVVYKREQLDYYTQVDKETPRLQSRCKPEREKEEVSSLLHNGGRKISLAKKMEELDALRRTNLEFPQSSLMC